MLSLGLLGCAREPAIEYGEALFSDPSFSGAATNVFSCATCHTRITDAGAIRPGYNLVNATRRPSYWGGFVGTLFDATSSCVGSVGFMRGNGLSETSEQSRALFLYLASLDDGAPAPALPLTVVTDIADLPSGDVARGTAVYKGVCADCHGDAGTGAGRLSTKQSIVPTDTINGHIVLNTGMEAKPRIVVIEKIRHGKYFMICGDMPLLSREALSDVQVGDLLAYFETFGLAGFGQ